MSTTTERSLSLNFGALAPALSDQVAEQGYSLPADEAGRFQKNHTAIVRLHIHGLLTDSEALKARRRLMKQVIAALSPTSSEGGTDEGDPSGL